MTTNAMFAAILSSTLGAKTRAKPVEDVQKSQLNHVHGIIYNMMNSASNETYTNRAEALVYLVHCCFLKWKLSSQDLNSHCVSADKFVTKLAIQEAIFQVLEFNCIIY